MGLMLVAHFQNPQEMVVACQDIATKNTINKTFPLTTEDD